MTDVAVIGAGVIGLSCARELARDGARVTVLEALPAVGHGSSARANGGFRAQFTTPVNIGFSLFSIPALVELERVHGGLGLHQTGYLLLTGTEDGERALRAGFELQRSLGAPSTWLSPDEALAHAPFVRPDGIRAGTFCAIDGFLDPAGVVAALREDALAAGAEILTDAAVTAAADGRVTHARGEVAADAVVNAAGANAADVATLFGSDLPVAPVRRNLAHVLDDAAGGELTPMTVDLDTGVLVRREPAGGWIVAYSNPADPPGWETSVDPRFLDDLAERVPERFPFLAELPIDPGRCWAGLYPETPDHHAIVGQDPAAPGLFHCAGFGGHGVMHAPAAGRAIAELVLRGRCEAFDLRPLRPTRFAEGDPVVETAVL
ncbi:MAG TPA: FAD-dependent oxidoreductase [Actinomycetota bacterium]|nr:FAD-dependent oxidoreductase [Actinomycetota bacterium]